MEPAENMLCKGLLEFVSKETLCPVARLSGGTRLREDLGLDGDDAAEFIEKFFVEFGVDAKRFKFKDYFGDDGLLPWFLFCWLRELFADSGLLTITIDDLNKAVLTKKWVPASRNCGGSGELWRRKQSPKGVKDDEQ